jgi:hypothetical protein
LQRSERACLIAHAGWRDCGSASNPAVGITPARHFGE